MSVERSLWVMHMVKRHMGIELTPEQANDYARAVNFGPQPDWDAWQGLVRQFDQFKPAPSADRDPVAFKIDPHGVAEPVNQSAPFQERRSGRDRRSSTANEELGGFGYGRRTPVQVEHDEALDARLAQINEMMASAKQVQQENDAKGAVGFALALLQLDGAMENKLIFEADRTRLATNVAERLNHMLRRND